VSVSSLPLSLRPTLHRSANQERPPQLERKGQAIVLPQGLVGCGRCSDEITPRRQHECPAPGSRGDGPGPVEVPAAFLEGGEERLGLVESPEGDERLDLVRDDPEIRGLPNAHRLLELDSPEQIRIGLGGSA
jgi:hypothetical protein